MARLISLQDIVFAEGFRPYDAANPAGYITLADLDAHLPLLAAPKASPAFTGPASFAGNTSFLGLVDVATGLLTLSSTTPNLTLGKSGQVSSPLFSFLSSGYAGRGYDVQFQVTGGSAASDGMGVINLVCNGFTINGASIAWGTASPATVLPLMDGPTALLGTSLNYARQDHVHQSDSTRLANNVAGTVLDAATSGTTLTISATGNTVNGAALRLLGNGATTPSKTVRVLSGAFQIRNDANAANLFSLTDAGAATFAGAVSGITTLSISGAISGATTYSGTGSIQAYVNAAAAPSAPSGFSSGSYVRVNAADSQVGYMLADTYAQGGVIGLRRSNNTGASPTALGLNDNIGSFGFYGYDGSSYATNLAGGIGGYAGATWSNTSHPMQLRFYTTAVSATVVTERMRLWQSGNVSLQPAGGTFTDDGVNALQVTGSAATSGAITTNANAASVPASPTGVTSLHTLNFADNTLGGLVLNGYGSGSGLFYGRRAAGTGAALTALAASSQITGLVAGGYDGAAWSGTQGGLYIYAPALWSGTSHPTELRFNTTPIASTTPSERMRVFASGNVSIQPNTVTYTDDTLSPLQVNLSTTAAWPTALSGVNPVLTGRGGDGSLPAVVLLGYGVNGTSSVGGAVFAGRRANGTNAAPTTLAANDQILVLSASGYDGTAWGSEQGALALLAGGTWSGTSHPTYQSFRTTDVAATANLERMRITPPGRVIIQPAGGTFTDDGVNALQVTGGVAISGIVVPTGGVSTPGAITMTSANTGIDLGAKGSANTPFIDFNSSGFSNDYDVRLIASGGTNGTIGKGTLTISAGQVVTPDVALSTDTSQSGMSGAWSSTTGTVGANTGTITATGTIRYKKVGRLVFCQAVINAITAGTGTGFVTLVMPFAANAAQGSVLSGRDGATGKAITGAISGATASMAIQFYDGTYPGQTGGSLTLSGVYEANA